MLVDIAKMKAVVVGKPVMASTEVVKALDNLFDSCRGFTVAILTKYFVEEAATRSFLVELLCLVLLQVSNFPSCRLEQNSDSYLEDSARLAFFLPLWRRDCLWVALRLI